MEHIDWNKNGTMRFRRATLNDAQILFEWRNDVETRRQSVSARKVRWKEHAAWLKKIFNDPEKTLYVVEVDDTPIGTVRTDKYKDGNELSWTIAPEARGLGFGKAMLKKTTDVIGGVLYAKIKSGNNASIKVAQYAGFELQYEEDALQHWRFCSISN